MQYLLCYLAAGLIVLAVVWLVQARRARVRRAQAAARAATQPAPAPPPTKGDRLQKETLAWMHVLSHVRKGHFLRVVLQRSDGRHLYAYLKAEQDRAVTMLIARYGSVSKASRAGEEGRYCLRGKQLLRLSESRVGALEVATYPDGDAETVLGELPHPLLVIHNFHSLREEPSIRLVGMGTGLATEWIKPWEMPTDFAETSGVADVAYSVMSAVAASARLDPEGRPGALAPRVFYLLGSGNGERLDLWFQRPAGLMAVQTKEPTTAETVYGEVLLRHLDRAQNRDAALRWSRPDDPMGPGSILIDYIDGIKGVPAVQDLSSTSVVMAFGTRKGEQVDVARLSSRSRVTSSGTEHFVEVRVLPAPGFSYLVVWLLE